MNDFEVRDSKVMRQTLRVIECAIEYKAKVERDAPDCFVPIEELQDLFDALEEMKRVSDER